MIDLVDEMLRQLNLHFFCVFFGAVGVRSRDRIGWISGSQKTPGTDRGTKSEAVLRAPRATGR
jgi:hypothetical protein